MNESYVVRSDPRDFLQHLIALTNMRVLNSEHSRAGKAEFVAANLYAKSIFGASLFRLFVCCCC